MARLTLRIADAMQDEVHHGDAHHLAADLNAEDRSLEKLPVGDFFSRTLAVGLEVRDVFLRLFERETFFLQPFLAVNRDFAEMVRVFGEDVLNGVDEEPARAAGGIKDGVAEVGIEHLDHRKPDLARGAELAEERAFLGGEVLEKVFVDVALDVGAEFRELDAVEFVHDLLEDIRVVHFETRRPGNRWRPGVPPARARPCKGRLRRGGMRGVPVPLLKRHWVQR